MATTSALGSGSGLNLNDLLTQMISSEKDPQVQLITQKTTKVSTTISALGALKSAASSFQSALSDLKSPNFFNSRTATASNTEMFSVTADGSADAGNYDISVLNLASANKIASGNFAGPDTKVGTGKLSISVGESAFDIDINSENNTVADIRDAINNAPNNTGVKASLLTVSDGAGGTATKLVLTAKDTGANSQIAVSVADDDGDNTDGSGLSQLYYSKSDTTNSRFTEVKAAQDATITVDGFTVTSATNVFDEAIPGVSITALKPVTDAGNNPTSATLSVAVDTDSIKAAIQKFVTAYNSYAFTYSQLTSYTPATAGQTSGTAGPLLGNSSANLLNNRLRRDLSDRVDGASANFNTLAAIGITTDADGSLKIDDAKLNKAINGNLSDVAKLFSGDSGVAGRLNSRLTDALASNGLFDNTQKTLQSQLDDLGKQSEDLDKRMAALEATYRAQFTALDSLVAQLKQTGSFLTQQLSNTNSSSS